MKQIDHIFSENAIMSRINHPFMVYYSFIKPYEIRY